MLSLKRDILDEDRHLYHSRSKLTEKKMEISSCGEVAEDTEIKVFSGGAIIDACTQVTNPFLETVLRIPGVASAAVTPYTLQVMKAQMYEWSEIEPALLLLMASWNLELINSKIDGEAYGKDKEEGR